MEIAFRTDVGKLREHNEDAGDYFLTDELLFAVVADGMGGHNAGDVASEMAVQSVRERWQEAPPAAEEEAIKEWLLQTVEAANRRIYAASVEHQEMSGMGTTLVCASCLAIVLLRLMLGIVVVMNEQKMAYCKLRMIIPSFMSSSNQVRLRKLRRWFTLVKMSSLGTWN